MVCYSHCNSRLQQGAEIDQLLRPFTAEKFSGERHAYSLSPATFLKPMNFMGPHTCLDLRLDKMSNLYQVQYQSIKVIIIRISMT